MFSSKANQAFELPAEPPTPPLPPPRSVYRTYIISEPDFDSDLTPLTMSSPSPSVTRPSPTRPIIHQRPLVLRAKQSSPTSAVPPHLSSAAKQYQTPSILSPTPTLVPQPSGSTSSPPKIQNRVRNGSIPLPSGYILEPTKQPTLSPSKSSHTLAPPADSSPTKSLRQKAFEKAQSPTPGKGHVRQKPSTGQRVKEGAFFAFVLLPMSCWYTRGGKMLGPSAQGKVELHDDDDASDTRGPRILEWTDSMEMRESISRTPTLTRRMSEDTYLRRNSLSRTPTTPKAPPMPKRESFDAQTGSITRERLNSIGRSESFDRTNSMTRTNTMKRGEAFDRTNSMTKVKTMGRRESFDRTGSIMRADGPPMARMNPMGRRDWDTERGMASFDTRQSMGMPPPIMVAERWV